MVSTCLIAMTMIIVLTMIIVEKEGSLLLLKLLSTLTMIVLRCRWSGRFDLFSLLMLQIDGKLFGYSNLFEGRFADVLRCHRWNSDILQRISSVETMIPTEAQKLSLLRLTVLEDQIKMCSMRLCTVQDESNAFWSVEQTTATQTLKSYPFSVLLELAAEDKKEGAFFERWLSSKKL